MPKPSKKGKGKKPPPPPSSSSSDAESDSDDERSYEDAPRTWGNDERAQNIEKQRESGALQQLKDQALDDLSSDDEDAGNATGRVPTHWYEGYDHIGYDVSGSKVVPEKPLDGLDLAIEADDGAGVTVYDKLNGRNVRISKRELEQIRRLKKGAFANPETEMYPDTFRSSVIETTPLHNAPEPKRRFIPSKWEGMRIHRLAQGLADGRLRTREENRRLRKEARDPERRFLEAAATMWGPEDVEDPSGRRKGPLPVPAPKLKLPGHEESYRPPAEYCVDDEGQPLTEPEEGQDFIPKQHDSLRRVGVYEKGVQERFERCLDLYLCPRKLKRRLAIDPESLVPKLPDPRDLKPFPNALCRSFIGHTTAVVALDCSRDGQWLATADESGRVLLWEVSTGKLMRETPIPGPLTALKWNPHLEHHVLAVAGAEGVYLVDTRTARGDDRETTKALLEGEDDDGVVEQRRDAETVGVWSTLQPGIVKCALAAPARTVAWHARGDYLATVSPDAIASMQCVVHRCSRRSSQAPLKRGDKGGQIQSCVFHPSKPFLFVASRTTVRLYHLARQELVKTLRSGCKWISCLAIHPGGDHCVVGSRDLRLCWHDLDLGEQAHRTLKYHDKALRAACFHPKSSRYPLMATCADDGTVQVFHAKVFDDLTTNPSIVPVKRLDASTPKGCLDCAFHPTQPWLFSASADGSVKLFHAL